MPRAKPATVSPPGARGRYICTIDKEAILFRLAFIEDFSVWWELAQNPRTVVAYYSSPPQLRAVEIHSVHLLRDGPTLELLVELAEFPDKPSPRWPSGANIAQARLRFFGLRQITLSGWGTSNTGDLCIEGVDGLVRFHFDCPTVQLSGLASFFDVPSIVGYVNESVH